jgi:MFS family permease
VSATNAPWYRQPLPRAVVALGITQIIGWGTTVYALGVLAKPIAAATGWRSEIVIAGFTCALLASGVVSTSVGRLIDRQGGRGVMTLGSLWVAMGLVAIALAPTATLYLLAWTGLGVGMRLALYDAAFATLVQVTPSQGRRAISYLTLFGGFASSVFWPIGHALNGAVGWRSTVLVFAALNLLVCLPLHWVGLDRSEPAASAAASAGAVAAAAEPTAAADPILQGRARRVAMMLFALVMSACAFVFGALAVLLPALLEANGVSAAAAVTLAAIKGAAQVGGRLGDIVYGAALAPLSLGRIAVYLLPLAFAVLAVSGGNFGAVLLFTILFGVSNGLVTIVRGAVPLALFGTKGYGEILGLLATPYLLLNATAPVIIAIVVERWGYPVAQTAMLVAGLLASVTLAILTRWHRGLSRQPPQPPASP